MKYLLPLLAFASGVASSCDYEEMLTFTDDLHEILFLCGESRDEASFLDCLESTRETAVSTDCLKCASRVLMDNETRVPSNICGKMCSGPSLAACTHCATGLLDRLEDFCLEA